MSETVWDQEFFRRRATGEQAPGPAQQPAAVTQLAPEHATIAGLLLARAEDDNTALLFEDLRWSWRELVREAAARSALLRQLRPRERPWHVGVLLENTPEYIFLIAGAALCGATVVGINPTRRGTELAADIRGTDCAMIVTDAAYGDLLDGIGHGVPQILDANAQPERREESDNRLRFGFGTEASTRDRAEFSRRYGCPLLESYGSSEGTCYIIHTTGTPDGALGVPQQGFEVEIVNASGEVCPAARFDISGVMLNPQEAIGEIVSRGAAARFEGYYNNPGASQDRLRDGDFWTGDLGYRDEKGFYWFAGRTADWLRVDSENFAAAPVEQILSRFPGVTAAAVYPLPDPVTGDQVMAALEVPGGEGYVPMTANRKSALEAEYAQQGRDHLLRL